jgi:putative copper resistance protein D
VPVADSMPLAHQVALAHVVSAGSVPPPVSAGRLLTDWSPNGWLAAGLTAVALAYLAGVLRLRRRGDAWSPWRTAAFVLGGLGSIVIATLSGLATYDDTLFSVHMVQHMVLSMVAPVFLALGAPITLALRTLPGRPRRVLARLLRSRFARVIAGPVVPFALFVGTMFAVYLTGIYQATLEHPVLHELLHAHLLLSGCLFFWPLLGLDPMPHRLAYPFRMLVVFVTLPAHAFLGVAIMSGTTVIAGGYYQALGRTWGASPLTDQHTGGAILWGAGDLVGLLLMGVFLVQWIRADEKVAARVDRAADRAVRERRDEAELAAYNAALAALAERSRPR